MACHDPTARKCAVLEISIALYGPLTQDLMSIFLCDQSPIDASKRTLTVDPTIQCAGWKYNVALACGIIFTPLIVMGVPFAMGWAARSLNRRMVATDKDGKHLMSDALKKEGELQAKAIYVSSWNGFSREQKDKLIEAAAHELQIHEMEAGCFLVSKFQMSMKQGSAGWYPQWYMLRRFILNLFYLLSQMNFGTVFDWRVMSMLLLTISSLLQYRVRPFRRDVENRLEMWSLQFLTIMVMVDYADRTVEGVAAIVVSSVLTVTYMVLLVKGYFHMRTSEDKAARNWNRIRRGQLRDTMGSKIKKLEEKGKKLEKRVSQKMHGSSRNVLQEGAVKHVNPLSADDEALDPTADGGDDAFETE